MLNLHFNQTDKNNVSVENWKDEKGCDWNDLGQLTFDQKQNAWVFWPENICDGITYFESLQETENAIKDELENA